MTDTTQKPPVRLPDPNTVAAGLSRITSTTHKLVQDYLEGHTSKATSRAISSLEGAEPITRSFVELAQKLMANPGQLVDVQLKLWRDYWTLWERTSRRMLGEQVEPVIAPDKGDRRFSDPEWAESATFDFIKQSYLLAARSVHQTVVDASGLDAKTAARVDFYTKQFVDAMSPTNTVVLNPTVLRATLESGGENLVAGLANLVEDLQVTKGGMEVPRQRAGAFELGKDLATSPGKVIFQNELMQLIQYEPTTEKVYKRPILVMSPWINKFYVLDLSPRNSWVRWAVSQGFTVFCISWVNPDERLAHKAFEDYLAEGPLAALDAIEKATGEHEVAAIGYCLGGTLLSCAMAYLAAKGDPRIQAATLFTTLTDFAEPGEVGVFIDEEQLTQIERMMDKQGYLDGSQMGAAWAMIRANDFVWSFVVHKYLLGKDVSPVDFLYWGADPTRMPARMHAYYLRNMYQSNLLREPGGVTMLGVPLDLRKVKVPMYFVSGRDDYVAPWKATYAGAKLFGGPTKFVLGGSGHVGCIVNPADSQRHGYATNPDLPATPDDWHAGATLHEGSWWPDWLEWVRASAGPQIAASTRVPGKGKLPALEDAPGSYVRVRC